MMQKIKNLVYDCFEGKYEGIGQTVIGAVLFAGLMHAIISFTFKQDYGYWILKDASKQIKVEFMPGLHGYDIDRDGHLDRLVSQSACYRPPILLENDISKESDLFRRMDKIYNSGFSRDHRLKK